MSLEKVTLPPVPRGAIVDKNGVPTPALQGWLQELFRRVGKERAPSLADLATSVDTDLSGVAGQLDAVADVLVVHDDRLDALEALPPNQALPSYTVATVPSAASNARKFIYVSNEVGGAVPAFSDGTNWRRVTDRAVIS